MRTRKSSKPTTARHRKALITGIGVVAALLLLASGYLWLIGAGSGLPPRTATIGGPFALIQGDGRHVTDQDFRGKYLLIYFGYTHCQDVCPATLTTLSAALDDLGDKAQRLQPVFITVDPERDSPAVIQQYIAAFTPLLVGLTGTPAAIRSVAAEYRVSSIIHAGSKPANYDVDHSSVLYLVGPEGRYIAPIRANETSAGMARIIARHLL